MEKNMSENEKKVLGAISGSSLKVSYKMKRALLSLAKRNMPIDNIEFFIEQMPQNQHGKGYADGAEVYYKYTAPNHHAVVSFEGDIWQSGLIAATSQCQGPDTPHSRECRGLCLVALPPPAGGVAGLFTGRLVGNPGFFRIALFADYNIVGNICDTKFRLRVVLRL